MQIFTSLRLLLSSIFFFVFLSSALAFQFSFSPSSIEFDKYSENCQEVEIYSEKPIYLSIEDKWAESDTNQILEYTLLKDIINYPKNLSVREDSSFEVCLAKLPEYNSYGLLIINMQNSSFSGGIWIKIFVGKENFMSKVQNKSPLTGFAVTDFSGQDESFALQEGNLDFSYIYLILFEVLYIFLLAICFFLVLKLAKKRQSY